MTFCRNQLKLYAITDSRWLNGKSLASQVELAIKGGATIIQLREKNKDYDELKALALEVNKVCTNYNVPLIINDNAKLAAEIDAAGVHVGQSDVSVIEARRILGPGKIVGATAKTIEQARLAEAQGADYLGSGAIFGSSTKTDALPMTPELLQDICHSVDIPVVAIGGIDHSNIAKLEGIDIAGAAVVSGIFAQQDVEAAADELCKLLSFIK